MHFFVTFIWDILDKCKKHTAGFHLLSLQSLKFAEYFAVVDWLYSMKRNTLQYWQGQLEIPEEKLLVLVRPLPSVPPLDVSIKTRISVPITDWLTTSTLSSVYLTSIGLLSSFKQFSKAVTGGFLDFENFEFLYTQCVYSVFLLLHLNLQEKYEKL